MQICTCSSSTADELGMNVQSNERYLLLKKGVRHGSHKPDQHDEAYRGHTVLHRLIMRISSFLLIEMQGLVEERRMGPVYPDAIATYLDSLLRCLSPRLGPIRISSTSRNNRAKTMGKNSVLLLRGDIAAIQVYSARSECQEHRSFH